MACARGRTISRVTRPIRPAGLRLEACHLQRRWSAACKIARVPDVTSTLLFGVLAVFCLLGLSASLPVALGRQPLVRLPLQRLENRAEATGWSLFYAALLLMNVPPWLNAGWVVSDMLIGAALFLMIVAMVVTIRGGGHASRSASRPR